MKRWSIISIVLLIALTPFLLASDFRLPSLTGSTLTDGGVLLGSGTGTITAMAVLADGELIVGDGTTDPVAESGATLRTSLGLGTGDDPAFNSVQSDAGTGTGTYLASGVISVDTTAVGTDADTVEKDLLTYSLPANSLSADGKGVRVTAWGTTAANGNTKDFRGYFGGTETARDAGAFNNLDWTIRFTVIRTGAATQDAIGEATKDGSGPQIDFSTPTEDETAAITIKITGQNTTAAANDVVAEGMMVEFLN